MADTAPHSTLRKVRGHVLHPRSLAVLAMIACVLTILAPFNTDQSMTLPGRALFWFATVTGTYAIGMVTDLLLRPRCAHLSAGLRLGVIAAATGLTTALAVDLTTGLLFGWASTLVGALQDFATVFVIGVMASLGVQIATLPRPAHGAHAETQRTDPALMDRVPLDKRGALVALSVEDHYVRVRTTKGEEMILMRLTDAIRETAPTQGMRVHRSHWVARAAVVAARRDGDRAILTMSHGGDIPASRSHISALKQAGLLPR